MPGGGLEEDYAISQIHLAADGVEEILTAHLGAVPASVQHIDIITVITHHPDSGAHSQLDPIFVVLLQQIEVRSQFPQWDTSIKGLHDYS